MEFKLKHLLTVAACGVFVWVSYGVYTYFFDNSMPHISINGLQEGGYYGGDLTCQISSSKNGELAILLDGQPLISSFKLSAKSQNHPFSIPTKTISNGQHTLKITLTDSTYYKNKAVIEHAFVVDNAPLQAALLRSDVDYKVFQGRTLHVQFQVNKPIKQAQVRALANTYECYPESPKSLIYECFIPVPCEETPNEYLFSAEITDKVGNKLNMDNKFQIVMYPFKKQILNVSAETVKKERELGLANNGLEEILQNLAAKSPHEKLWRGSFCTPIDIAKITCDFGTIRTTQEKGRYMHKALDVINAPRSVIWATADGIVVLKERFAGSGNTVVLDHGCGVLSLFYHLEDFADIKLGQKVAKGSPIGTLGKTGYATGYHLHWEMRVNNIAIDPMQWTKSNF